MFVSFYIKVSYVSGYLRRVVGLLQLTSVEGELTTRVWPNSIFLEIYVDKITDGLYTDRSFGNNFII